MTEHRRRFSTVKLREECPSNWQIIRFRSGLVVGFGPTESSYSACCSGFFHIYPTGDLWRAVWWPPVTEDDPVVRWPERVTGIEERCFEWVLEKAEGLGEE